MATIHSEAYSHSTLGAPFFRPGAGVRSQSQFFAPGTSSSQTAVNPPVIVQRQQMQQRPRTSTKSSNYFKEFQGGQQMQLKRVKEVANEFESKSGERLTLLHTKLQQEAEKIRKWKTATEVELKHKEKCLEESQQTIESQRKSLMDLKLKNESLSSSLQQEVSYQREIRQKISATRDMCSALKNHSLQVEQTLCQGQCDKEQLVEMDQDRMLQFTTLLERFKQLEAGQTEWKKAFQDALKGEKSKNSSLNDTCEELRQQLEKANNENTTLKEECAGLKESIEQLNEGLREKDVQFDNLVKEKANLEHVLCLRYSELNKLEGQLDDVEKQLTSTQSQLSDKERLLASAKETVQQNEETYDKKLAELESNLSTEKGAKQVLAQAKDELATELVRVKETLSSEKDQLSFELVESKRCLEVVQLKCVGLEESLAREKNENIVIVKEKEALSCRLDDLELKLETVNKEMELKNESIVSLQTSLENSQTNFVAAQQDWKERQAQLSQQLTALQEEKERLESQTVQLTTQLLEAQSNSEQLQKTNKQGANEYQKCIEELKSSNREREVEIVEYKAKLESLTKKEDELVLKCSELDKLKKEYNEVQETLKSQSSNSKQLQDELSEAHSKLTAKSKELSNLEENYKKKTSDDKKAYDAHVKELYSTMQRYSAESEKMAQRREKQIDSLKQQLEDNEKSKGAGELKLEECQRQLEQAKTELSVKSNEIKELLKAVDCMQSNKGAGETQLEECQRQLEQAKTELSVKSNEIKELLKAVDCMQSNKPSSIVPSTPRTTSTPLTSSNILHSVSTKNSVSKTPKYSSCKLTSTTPKLSHHSKITTSTTASTFSTPVNKDSLSASSVLSTPSRMYNYSYTTQRLSGKNRPPPSTPKSASRAAKKMKCHSDDVEEKVLPDTVTEDDETIFKKPKGPRVTSTTSVRKASRSYVTSATPSSTSTRKPLKSRNGAVYKKKTVAKKSPEANLSWFEIDSVYGFGPDD